MSGWLLVTASACLLSSHGSFQLDENVKEEAKATVTENVTATVRALLMRRSLRALSVNV